MKVDLGRGVCLPRVCLALRQRQAHAAAHCMRQRRLRGRLRCILPAAYATCSCMQQVCQTPCDTHEQLKAQPPYSIHVKQVASATDSVTGSIRAV